MELGVFFFATDYSIDIAELAVELEQRGFTALLQPEHTHIPASRKTEWPGGGDLPRAARCRSAGRALASTMQADLARLPTRHAHQ